MSRADNALKFMSTVLVEGTAGTVWSVGSNTVANGTRMTTGQKVAAKTVVGFIGGGLLALVAPRLGGGVVVSTMSELGNAIAERAKLQQRYDRMVSGNALATGGTNPASAIGPGNGNGSARARTRAEIKL